MLSTYAEAISRVLKSEGGYVNNPKDPGGPTNFGITQKVYQANGHPGATAADVKAMPLDEAKRIYKLKYADPVRYDSLPAGGDYAVLDYAVNSGVGRANKVLRRVCGLPDIATSGDVLAALNKRDRKAVINAVCDERLAFLKSLKTWPTFGAGWQRRVAYVRSGAVQIADAPINTARDVNIAPPPSPGKGEVPKPSTAGPVIAGSGGGGAVTAPTWADWIAAHPVSSLAVAAAAVIALVLVAEMIARRWQRNKQEAPMPITPVPELEH